MHERPTLPEPLSRDERQRYARQLALPEIGTPGQARLKGSSVLVVGAGGLGAPVALYLAAAGVGHLGLVDWDEVEASNLHRQVLYGHEDIGRPKALAAARRLRSLNPCVEVETHEHRLDPSNARTLISSYDVVVDGTDTFASRYLINDACIAEGVPDVYASVYRFEGQASVWGYGGGPCYRCLFDEPPPAGLAPSCDEGGVLGVLPGVMGLVQATETLKVLLGIGETLAGRLLVFDALAMQFRTLRVSRNPSCPACGSGAPSPPDSSRPMPDVPEISVTDLHRMREEGQAPFLLDVRQPDEYAVANLEGSLIPLKELPDRLGELESHRSDPILVVHCRSGARSAKAVELLRAHGFENAVNLRGGILAWSDEIDPSIPKY